MKKQITGQDSCYPNRPANLPYSRVKLHYIIHYINRGSWDHIIDEEPADFNERKIESYTCNICNKVCKNNLEKREYPGRSTALCHLATDHGRLLKVCTFTNTFFQYMISLYNFSMYIVHTRKIYSYRKKFVKSTTCLDWFHEFFVHKMHTVWKSQKFTLTEKIFRQINSLVISIERKYTLVSRNFW